MDGVCEFYVVQEDGYTCSKKGNVQFLLLFDDRFFEFVGG